MPCNFSFQYPQPKEELVSKLKDAILNTGGEFEGDACAGTFQCDAPIGIFRGNYTIDDDTVTVNVDKKPMLIGCGRIESEIHKYLGIATA